LLDVPPVIADKADHFGIAVKSVFAEHFPVCDFAGVIDLVNYEINIAPVG
jgi:hypothetical protein